MPRIQKSQIAAFSIGVANCHVIISILVVFYEKLEHKEEEKETRQALQDWIKKLRGFCESANRNQVIIPAGQYYGIVDFFEKTGSDQHKINTDPKTKKTALEILCEAEALQTSNIANEDVPTKEILQNCLDTVWQDLIRELRDNDIGISQPTQQVVFNQVRTVFSLFSQYQLAEIGSPIQQSFEMQTGFRMLADTNTVEEKKETFAGTVFNSVNFQFLTQDIVRFAEVSMHIAAIAQLIKTLVIDTEGDKEELCFRLDALQKNFEEQYKALLAHPIYASLLKPLQKKIRDCSDFLKCAKLPIFLLNYQPLNTEENIVSILNDIYEVYNPLLLTRETMIASISDLLAVDPENQSSQHNIGQPKRLKQLMGQLQENLRQDRDGFTKLITEKCAVCLIDGKPTKQQKAAVKEGQQILLIRKNGQYFLGYYFNKDQTYVQRKLDLNQSQYLALKNDLNEKMQGAFTGCVTNDLRLKDAIYTLIEQKRYGGSCYKNSSLFLLSLFRASKKSKLFCINEAIRKLDFFQKKYLRDVEDKEYIGIPKKALNKFTQDVIRIRLEKIKGSLSHGITTKNTEIMSDLRRYTDALVALNEYIMLRYAAWKDDVHFLEKMQRLHGEIARLAWFDSRNDVQQQEKNKETKLIQPFCGYYNPASGFSIKLDLENVFCTGYQYQQYRVLERNVKESEFESEEQADGKREDEKLEIRVQSDSALERKGEKSRVITMRTPIIPHFFSPNCFLAPGKSRHGNSINMTRIASSEQAIRQWCEFYKDELQDHTLLTVGQPKPRIGFEGKSREGYEEKKPSSSKIAMGLAAIEILAFFGLGGAWKVMTDNAITAFMPAEVFGVIGIVFLTVAVATLAYLAGKKIHQAITKYDQDKSPPVFESSPAFSGNLVSRELKFGGSPHQPQSESGAGIGSAQESNPINLNRVVK